MRAENIRRYYELYEKDCLTPAEESEFQKLEDDLRDIMAWIFIEA
jgi:hypothetical protein